MNKNHSHTKRGPGRSPIQGKPGGRTLGRKAAARGFRGATFAPARPLSALHPTIAASLRAARLHAAAA